MLCHARDTSASMAGCMMFKKKNWEENQKFDSCMGKLADIDFCLKGSRNHKLNVWTSYSEILYTGENLIPETGDSEISAFKNEWKEEIVKRNILSSDVGKTWIGIGDEKMGSVVSLGKKTLKALKRWDKRNS